MKILDCEETRALEERAVDYGASYSEADGNGRAGGRLLFAKPV